MGIDRTYKSILLQAELYDRGFYTGLIDDVWGPKSQAAYDAFLKTILAGSPTWTWFAEIDGNDIVVKNAWATCFGGSSDPQDSGETASGYPTNGHDDIIACALPLDGYGVAELKGSPLPKMPFGLFKNGTQNPDGAFVIAEFDGVKTPSMPVLDLGPAKKTGNSIDLSIAAAQTIHPHADAQNFKVRLTKYTILGGKKWIKRND